MNDLPANIEKAFQFLRKALREIYGEPEGDALAREILLDATGMDRSALFLQKENRLTAEQWQRCTDALQRLQKHEPLQYILGYTEFMDLEIMVGPGVLVPRPETEEMVNYILEKHPQGLQIIDLCTGSGCIALALAKGLKPEKIWASDISEQALGMARKNALRYGLDIHFVQDDVLHPLWSPDLKVDIITCNPPYVRDLEKRSMKQNVLHWEPEEALFVPDDDPLLFYRALRDFAGAILKAGGYIYMEINEALATETAGLFKEQGYTCRIFQDIHEKNRYIEACLLYE